MRVDRIEFLVYLLGLGLAACLYESLAFMIGVVSVFHPYYGVHLSLTLRTVSGGQRN